MSNEIAKIAAGLTSGITLRCDNCKREMSYARDVDPSIPADVATIVVSRCDQCDDGDFGTEWWLDVNGKHVEQSPRAHLQEHNHDS